MKSNSILSIYMLIIISTGLCAQDFFIYKLFDNKFQAVFPSKPNHMQIPKKLLDPIEIEKSIPHKYRKQLSQQQLKKAISDIINRNNIQAYLYSDRIKKVAYISKSMISGLKYDVRDYNKKSLDNSFKNTQIYENNNAGIFYFSSKLDRKNNIYTYFLYYTRPMDGIIIYHFSKNIIFKKIKYMWTVSSPNFKAKDIFDGYKDYCKVLN